MGASSSEEGAATRNVTRLRWWREVIWAAFFLTVTVVQIVRGRPSWLVVALCTVPITLSRVLSEVCSANYRGIGWSYIEAWRKGEVGRDSLVDRLSKDGRRTLP